MLDARRQEVADACRALAGAGLVAGASGNVSAREGDRIVVTPAGAELRAVAPRGLTVVGLDGTVVDGPPPSSELLVHLGVYARLPARAVVHSHDPAALAAAERGDTVGDAPVIAWRAEGSAELAGAVVEALAGGSDIVVMRGHGTFAWGPDARAALRRTLALAGG